jgi:hypothetical protein
MRYLEPMGEERKPGGSIGGRRRSLSMELSRRAALERILEMSPVERMALALALGRRRRALAQERNAGAPE